MDIREIVSRGEPENRHLAYFKHIGEKRNIVETLVGMSNAEGGTVVVGAEVAEGSPTTFTDVASRNSLVDEIEDELQRGVEPVLKCRTELFRIGATRFVAFTVPPSERIRSIQDESAAKPVFPTRARTELEYLSGNDIDSSLELSSQKPS